MASKGELIHVVTQRMANFELGIPVQPITVVVIGSVSKQIASALALMLANCILNTTGNKPYWANGKVYGLL